MLSCMGSCQVLAQFPYFVKANYIGGRVIPHRAGMDELKSTVNGAELELGVQLNGNDDWHV
ncbi:MAG: hypothetical protein ACQES1_07295, partial [Bacteroidota bacterium]